MRCPTAQESLRSREVVDDSVCVALVPVSVSACSLGPWEVGGWASIPSISHEGRWEAKTLGGLPVCTQLGGQFCLESRFSSSQALAKNL